MPRTHGRIMAAIWNDDDFLAMRGSAQRMFMFLLSQSDLSHAGLIPMRVRRWATKAHDLEATHVSDELAYLTARGFLVTDDATEEVLVRTFVRNDGVYKQPRVMDRLREDAKQIESPTLRSAFRVELDRLPLHELSTEPGGPNRDKPSTREQVERVVETLREDFGEGIGDPTERVSGRVSPPEPAESLTSEVQSGQSAGQDAAERVSETHTDTPRVRAGVFHQPPTTIPQPPSTVPATPGGGEPGAELAVPDQAPTAQTLVGEWIDHCNDRPPGRVVGQVSKELKTLLSEGIDPDRIRRALAEWNRKGLHPSTLPSVVHEIANRAVNTRGQQATDDMFDRAMQRAIARERTA